MKSLLLFTTFFLISIQTSFSQISFTPVADYIEKPENVKPYDSLNNFLANDFLQYKGQELYLIPLAEQLRELGYQGFLIDFKKSYFDKSNQFNCCAGNYSKYDDLAGKYFIVEDVLKASSYPGVFLKLKMKETSEILYFAYNSKYEHTFPFIVVGFYEKQKQIFVNNEILIREFPKIEGANQKKNIDIETGEEILVENGKYYKCIDITISQTDFELSLLVQNEKGQKFLFPFYARFLNIQRIMTKNEAETYRLKFGDGIWQIILNEKISIGFAEEMAIIAWGLPEKINRASYGDQWVYPNQQYLYFENGILKSFN